MSRYRNFDFDRVEWLAEDMLNGKCENFWQYVDSQRVHSYAPLQESTWEAERADDCVALSSTRERCGMGLSVSGSPFCDFHESRALEWMLALLDFPQLRGHRRELADAREAAVMAATREPDYVYFYELEGHDLIKIGHSRRPKIRTSQFRSGTGCTFPEGIDPKTGRLLGYIPGGGDLESRLHLRFRGSRVVGEWFTATPKLRTFIRQMLASDEAVAS